MFSKRHILFFFLALLITLFLIGVLYIYKKKNLNVSSIKTDTNEILKTDTKDSYLHKKNIIFTDFENYDKNETIEDKDAYSGKYCNKVFGKNSFSTIITKPVAEIGKENFQKVGLSAMVYIFPENFNQLKADLVFSVVDSKGENVFWKGITLVSIFMEANKWTKITGTFDIDINTIPYDGTTKTYLWNDSKTKILIDDILVILGTDQVFRGDTTYCDNSIKNGWKKQFNHPPFPSQYLILNPIDNENSAYLIKNKSFSVGKIFPHTKIGTGNFYNTQNQKDKIIVVEENILNTYSYCDQYKTFSNDLSLMLYEKDTLWQTASLLSGKFTGKAEDEIFLFEPVSKIINLISINNDLKTTCPKHPAEMKLNLLWEGTYDAFKFNNKELPVYFTPYYLNNLQKVQLLCIYGRGDWQIFEFQKTKWDVVAQSKKPVKEWDAVNYNYNIISAKFLSKTNNYLLLSVSTSKKNNKSVYSVLSFNRDNKSFTEINGSQKSKIWGIDTLKASDFLFPFKDDIDGVSLMRYNNEWRFDLKNIIFNDSTYQILSNIDFKGYPNNYNPKFYETVRLIPGCFIENNKTSIMTICYNLKSSEKNQYANHNFLPNAIHFFTMNSNKKN